MKSYYQLFRKAAFACFLITLFMVLLAGCGIQVGTQSSSLSAQEEISGQGSRADLSESEESEETLDEESEVGSMSQISSQESEYFSILDFIPEHKKHFLQKKDRVTGKEESSEEESSEEESRESEDSEEESEEETSEEEQKESFSTKYLIRINKTTNVITVYEKDDSDKHTVPVKVMICSTGTMTPIGTFMMGYQSRWKGLVGGQWTQCVSHISGDFLIQSVPYQKKSPDSMIVSSYNALGTTATSGSVYLNAADAYWIYMNCMAYNTVIQIGYFGNSDPWGKPSIIRLPASQNINWDPSDPSEGNPWNTKGPYFTGIRDYTIYVGESTPDLLKNVRGFDTCGNEQTGLIRVSGAVNGYVPGTYTVTYYLTDVLGRTGVQRAYVTVKAKTESSRPENSKPEYSRPESSEPERSEPESSTPESSRPESSTPESSRPESSTPESSRPESSTPESSTPESSRPESSRPESSEPETSEPESSRPESSEPDASKPENSAPESSEPESAPENSAPESTRPETSEPENSGQESSESESIGPETSVSESSVTESAETEFSEPAYSAPESTDPEP